MQLSSMSSAGSSTCLLWGLNSEMISNGVVATVSLVVSPTTKNTSSSIQLINGGAAGSNGATITTSTSGATLSIVSQASEQVNLASSFNRVGIPTDGTTWIAYSVNLLGSTVTFNGSSFTLGPANAPATVTSTTVLLPAGEFSALTMLGAAVGANQPSRIFTGNGDVVVLAIMPTASTPSPDFSLSMTPQIGTLPRTIPVRAWF